jgi:hypothetical protein
MTNKTLLALAERCEKAEGPDHVLDAEIACAIHGYTMHEDSDPSKGIFAFWEGEPWKSVCGNCSSWAEWTASLEAAMTLVPEGWDGQVQFGRFPGAWVGPPDRAEAADFNACATPALALTAAALRARAAQVSE